MSESPFKMKGMDFGTGKSHGAGNSPVKFWGALAGAAAKGVAKEGAKAVVKEGAKAAVKAGAKAAVKGAAKTAAKTAVKEGTKAAAKTAVKEGTKTAVKEGTKTAAKETMGKKLKKEAMSLGKKAISKAATDTMAEHQEAKNKVPSNAPTVQF